MANYEKYYIAVRLLLLKQYLEANAGRNRIVKWRELEDLLKEHDMPVEKKTLYQDFAALGDVCGLQLEYDVHKKGYRLLNPPFEPYELRLLVDSVQSSKFITREKAREITTKLKKFAGKDTVESLSRENHVANRVRSMNDSVVKDADRIHEAIRKDLKIGFRYFHYTPATGNEKTYSKDGQQLIVSPYALLWNNGNYYLYAYDGKKFRYYRVDRMERISQPLAMTREGKELYREKDMTHQKAKVFDMFGGKAYDVRIRFRNELADAVIDQFGKDIQMFAVDAEHFTITAPIEVSPTFFAWVLGFGGRMKLLSPESAVKELCDVAKASIAVYDEA